MRMERQVLSLPRPTQMADEAGVPSFDSLDAVATLQRSERYQTVMKARPGWLLCTCASSRFALRFGAT